MENQDDDARLKWLLSQLEGAECFSTLVGSGEDYALVLDIGDRKRRSLRLSNPRLSFLQRTYEGASGLLVECPWRIDTPDGVAASCFDDRSPGGRGATAVQDLASKTVISAVTEAPGYDLVLRFSEDWVLRIFALETAWMPHKAPLRSERSMARDEDSPGSVTRKSPRNWSVWTPGGSLGVGAHGHLEGPTDAPEPSPSSAIDPDPPIDIATLRAKLERGRGSNDE